MERKFMKKTELLGNSLIKKDKNEKGRDGLNFSKQEITKKKEIKGKKVYEKMKKINYGSSQIKIKKIKMKE